MKRLGLVIALLAGLVFVLPSLTAQNEKKDDDKAAKKDDAKDPEKKDDEKKKSDPAKDKKPVEKLPPFGAKFKTKIMSANGASNREFTVELQEVDPKKVYELNTWKAQQSQSLTNAQLALARATTPQARLQAQQGYQRAVTTFSMELAKRQGNIYTAKPFEVRATEDAKVRTMFLPIVFDDQGFPKKWTEKEKKEFRGETLIPGYPSDFDAIKSGQYVEIYMVKKAPPAKDAKDAKEKDAPRRRRGMTIRRRLRALPSSC